MEEKSVTQIYQSNQSNMSGELEFADDEVEVNILDESTAATSTVESSNEVEQRFVEVAHVLAEIIKLSGQVEQLQQGFDTKVKYDNSKDRTIDALHKELQDHREGLHFKILRPLFMDLIALYDDLGNVIKHIKSELADDDTPAPKALKALQSFQESVEDTLYRHGAESFEEEGDLFSGHRQRAIKTEPTDRADQDRLVAHRLRKGFEYDGRLLRPEMVAIFKFTENDF
jgi:molecular chaperone GrpE